MGAVELDGDTAVEALVVGDVDAAHRPAPQPADDAVGAELRRDRRRMREVARDGPQAPAKVFSQFGKPREIFVNGGGGKPPPRGVFSDDEIHQPPPVCAARGSGLAPGSPRRARPRRRGGGFPGRWRRAGAARRPPAGIAGQEVVDHGALAVPPRLFKAIHRQARLVRRPQRLRGTGGCHADVSLDAEGASSFIETRVLRLAAFRRNALFG